MVSSTLSRFISRFQLQLPLKTFSSQLTKSAAVLVPIVCHTEPTLLLTRRATHLRQHAGEVAFPGGVADKQDKSLMETALREAQEEIGLAPHHVRILGQLPCIDSVSGFCVTPVLGLISPKMTLEINANEVAELFEVPLHLALNRERYQQISVKRAEQSRAIYMTHYQHHLIWGLTAAVIYRLSQQIG